MNSKSKPENNPKTGSKMTPKNTREINTNSTEGCHLLTQKHQLCPGKPNFKPGPILVDEFIHLHLESHFLTKLRLRILLFPNLHDGFNTCPVYSRKNTIRRDSIEILFAKHYHTSERGSQTFFYILLQEG